MLSRSLPRCFAAILSALALLGVLSACSDTPNPPTLETPAQLTRSSGFLTPTEITAINTELPSTVLPLSSATPRLGAIVTATPLPPTQTPLPEPPTPPSADTPIPSPLPTDTALPATSYSAVVNDDDVNFRTGPGFQYRSLGKYSRGTPLSVYAKDSTGAWLQVSITNGPSGWMMTQYIKVTWDVASLPLATALPAPVIPPTPVFSADATVDDNDVNLRTGPGFEYPSQGKYSNGTPLKVLGRNLNDEWLKVTVAGTRTGWMMTQYIALKADLVSIPVSEAPAQPSRPAATHPILMALVSKSYQPIDSSAGVYDDYIAITLEITNRTGRKVRAFTGSLVFYDLFDRYIYSGQLTYEDGLAVGGTVRINRTISYNQFLDSHVRLRTIKQQDVKTEFSIEEVIFSDGSRQSYP